MRVVMNLKTTIPAVTRKTETAISIQCGTYRSALGRCQLKAMRETFSLFSTIQEPSNCRDPDNFKVLLPYANGIKKTGHRHKSDQLHKKP